MKKRFRIATLLVATLIFAACEDDTENDPRPTNATTQAQQTEATIINGLWAVTRFIDDNENETSDYQGWSFNFQANGALIASKENTTYNGNWLTRVDDGQAELVITMQGPEFIQELNEDWKIMRQSATVLELEDDDPPYRDELFFTKL